MIRLARGGKEGQHRIMTATTGMGYKESSH
jgi:hypothetical protein